MNAKGKKESKFQADLIKQIKSEFPECMVLKNDSGYLQGVPDLLILNDDKWVSLECKRSADAHRQPNQEFYVAKMNAMSYSSFVCPENKEEVMNDIRATFKSER